MIIYSDKRYITNSEHPNDDWTGHADFIIPDGSELAEKIISLYPNFEFVFDGDGNIFDVVEIEPVPLPPDITTEQRMTAMENAMEEIINMLMEV